LIDKLVNLWTRFGGYTTAVSREERLVSAAGLAAQLLKRRVRSVNFELPERHVDGKLYAVLLSKESLHEALRRRRLAVSTALFLSVR
jgi:hypothetical protein